MNVARLLKTLSGRKSSPVHYLIGIWATSGRYGRSLGIVCRRANGIYCSIFEPKKKNNATLNMVKEWASILVINVKDDEDIVQRLNYLTNKFMSCGTIDKVAFVEVRSEDKQKWKRARATLKAIGFRESN